jgi:sugar-phosphatase
VIVIRLDLSCRAVLFDLDGVLVYSEPVVVRTWRRWAARHGLDLPDLVSRAHGRRSIETVREVAPWLDAEAEVEWLSDVELADGDGLAALPGAARLFEAIPSRQRAIVTSGGRALAAFRLRAVGLTSPEVLIAAEDVEHGKPAPDGYLAAARRLDAEPGECIVIEDAPAGIAAGRAAGATVIAVATTFLAAELRQAHVVIDSLASLGAEVEGGQLRLHGDTRA